MSALAVALWLAAQTQAPAPAPPGDGWAELSRDASLSVWSRHRAGSEVNEMYATAVVDAPACAVWATVFDLEGYTKLLPFTTVSRVLARAPHRRLALQRSEMPLLQAREYVIDVTDRADVVNGRARFEMSWRADASVPVAADAVHISVNEGAWQVDELADGRARVTFRLFLDPAGSVPPLFVNLAQKQSAADVLAALERTTTRRSAAPRTRSASRSHAVAACTSPSSAAAGGAG